MKDSKSSFNIPYHFISQPWKYEGHGSWIFITLPENFSQEIRGIFKTQEEGWGRLSVRACIGNTEWNTAIWFDTKKDAYLLPLKAEIRKKEKIVLESDLEVTIYL